MTTPLFDTTNDRVQGEHPFKDLIVIDTYSTKSRPQMLDIDNMVEAMSPSCCVVYLRSTWNTLIEQSI